MPWAKARGFIEAAGWVLDERADGSVDLLIEHGSRVGTLVAQLPAPEDIVDGHALLRHAGAGRLDTALADSVTDQTASDEVLVGLNWTMVRAGSRAGIARSPERGTQGARTVRQGEPIAGRPLAALAQWICSVDPLRRSIGLAAINAFWNRLDGPGATGDWGFAGFKPPGEGLVIVGGFRAALKRLPAARVIEREPKGNDIPIAEAGPALANAQAVAVTAQTLMNGSLEPLLPRIVTANHRLLVGPSAPVTPVVLDAGLTRVSGLAITDPDAAASFIKETGTMIALDDMTSQLELVG